MLGLMLLSMLFEILGIGLVVPVIGLLAQDDYASRYPILQPLLDMMGSPSHLEVVIYAMLGLIVVYLIKAIYLAFYQWKQLQFAFGIQAHLSQRLFKEYLLQPYVFHLQRNSAQLIRNATVEIGMFINNAINPILVLASEVLVIVGLCFLLLYVEPLGSLIVVSIVGFFGWVFHYFTHEYMTTWGKQRQLHEGLRIQHLQQGLGGVKDVKLLGRENEFLRQYKDHNFKTARAGRLSTMLLALPRLWLEVLAISGLAALVITMSLLNYGTGEILAILGLFAAAAFRLIPSVARILRAAQSLRYGLPVINVLFNEFSLARSFDDDPKGDHVPFRSSIKFKGVSYTYPGAATPTLSGITLHIDAGESIGLIGSSGAGKSTLVDIMLGLLKPDNGEVLVDGNNIQESLRDWKDQLGYVPQSIYLTDDTLRHNIAFGLPEEQIEEDRVWMAIQLAQLADFVHALPDGVETMVGERGVRLSGGQRQRIGIARALYHDPPVLVLDEATSSLDTDTEKGVMEAVRALSGKKTIIIIAHRLTTVEHCDRLYELKCGVIEREGKPGVLLP